MARLISSGFENNSATGTVEGTGSGQNGSPVIQTTTKRGFGSYAMQISSLVSATQKRIGYQASSGTLETVYGRLYLYIVTPPSAPDTIMKMVNSGGSTRARIKINNNRTLELSDTGGTIGSTTTALTANTWYRIEWFFDHSTASGSHVFKVRIYADDTSSTPDPTLIEEFGATNRTITSGIQTMHVGGNVESETETTGEWYIDDVALNDNSGSYQNSWPGPGSIFHLMPNAAGDANTFATQTGGTAGAANNYTRVDEVPPNDASDFNGSNTLNQTDLFNVAAPPTFGAAVTVNLVAVGTRQRNSAADATTAWKARLLKTSGGTIQEGSATVHNSTTWRTNGSGAPFLYPIMAYVNPDGGAWDEADLATLQVGYIISTGGTNRVDFSNVWAHVEAKFTATVTHNLSGVCAITTAASSGLDHAVPLAGATAIATTAATNALVAYAFSGATQLSFAASTNALVAYQLAGVVGVSIGASSSLDVAKALSGATAMTFGPTAPLSVSKNLSAATAATFGLSSNVSLSKALSGATAIAIGASSGVNVAWQLAGATSLTFAPQPSLSVAKSLQAASALVFGAAGVVESVKALSGLTALSVGASGNIMQTVSLSGVCSISFAPTVVTNVSWQLAGATSITFTTTESLTVLKQLTPSTCAITTTTASNVSLAKSLAGATAITFTAMPALSLAKALAAATSMTFGVSSGVGVVKSLAAVTSVTFSTSAGVQLSKALAGAASFSVGASGALELSKPLAGVVDAVFAATAQLTRVAQINGAVGIVFGGASDLVVTPPFTVFNRHESREPRRTFTSKHRVPGSVESREPTTAVTSREQAT